MVGLCDEQAHFCMMILIRKIISCGKMLMLQSLVVGLDSSVFMKKLEIMQSLVPLPFDYPAKCCLSISIGKATEVMLGCWQFWFVIPFRC